MSFLQSLKYSRGSLAVLDQLKIPNEKVYIPVETTEDTWNVIKKMQVRGAPLIAIVAALGLAVVADKKKSDFATAGEAGNYLIEQMTYLRTSRPTAVNLFVATDELTAMVIQKVKDSEATPVSILDSYIIAAEKMLQDDIDANRALGLHGAKRILEITGKPKVKVLTICNTGSLATAGYGTALGVVRALHEMGKLEQVYACETRPYNQGARLTAFEIVQDKLPGTLIADSMASALMAVKGVDCVVVGADRVAANGDTANKIGTYQLAITAQYHGIPFFAAVPTTTLDLTMASGKEIEVEERPSVELTTIFGQQIAPVEINAWNPAFDVTPANLIRGVITELGVIEPTSPPLVIDVAGFLQQRIAEYDQKKDESGLPPVALMETLRTRCVRAVKPAPSIPRQSKTDTKTKTSASEASDGPSISSDVPEGYMRMSEQKVAAYLLCHADLAARLKIDELVPKDKRDSKTVDEYFLGLANRAIKQNYVTIKEVGDGNLNFVFIVEGKSNEKVVVKQALPYVRCVGESWPLTLQRAYFEQAALSEERRLTQGAFVPELYHYDPQQALIVMEFIPPPHLILRKHLIANTKINSFAEDIGIFLAKTLFNSSGLALGGGELREKVAHWSKNVSMCALTEKVIFTDPYTDSALNKWTSPQLDAYALGIKHDPILHLAAAHFKSVFLTSTQALLHGDLHTGSVMAFFGSTCIIDPEFAFYGPMGFDIAAIMSNLFLAYFAQYSRGDKGIDYAEWLLLQITILHDTFVATFMSEWDEVNKTSLKGNVKSETGEISTSEGAEIYAHKIFGDENIRSHAQADFLNSVWRDTLGFIGMKMIRRIVGVAHVEDLESIKDPDLRSICERKALMFARTLLVAAYENNYSAMGLASVVGVIDRLARNLFIMDPPDEWPIK